MLELGVANYESTGWYGMLVPSGTPKAIVQRLNQEVVAALKLPDLREKLVSQGGDPVSSTPEQFAAFIGSELAKWSGVIRTSGIQVD
jgi:tripartite-type tricarboxylate transporter receptor subunit TctC